MPVGTSNKRHMQRDELVFIEILARVIRAINRRHEMRVIENNRQQIERHRPRMDCAAGISSANASNGADHAPQPTIKSSHGR